MCLGRNAIDWMTHPEEAGPREELVWCNDNVITGPIGRGDPLGIPMGEHKRMWVEWSCITCKTSDGESSPPPYFMKLIGSTLAWPTTWLRGPPGTGWLTSTYATSLHPCKQEIICLVHALPCARVTGQRSFYGWLKSMFSYSPTCASMTIMDLWSCVMSSFWCAAGAAGREGEAGDHAALARNPWIAYQLAH